MNDRLDLVRIGAPPRLELAGWRYGDQFGRRRRKRFALLGLTVGVTFIPLGAASLGTGIAAFGTSVVLAHTGHDLWKTKKATYVPTVFVDDGEGGFLPLAEHDTWTTMLHPIRETGGWCVTVKHRTREAAAKHRRSWLLPGRREAAPGATTLRGEAARRALAILVPHANGYGGSARHVRDAMGVIEAKASLHRLIYDAATIPGLRGADNGANHVTQLPAPVRLALEMVLHDEDEQRAMEGELAALEQRWRDAEEIATIADSLLLPEETGSRFDALKRMARRGG